MDLIDWLILLAVNVPVYLFFGWLFFDSWIEFFESIAYFFTDNLISAFRGEYWDDTWSSMKFILWLACCVITILIEVHYFGDTLFG